MWVKSAITQVQENTKRAKCMHTLRANEIFHDAADMTWSDSRLRFGNREEALMTRILKNHVRLFVPCDDFEFTR